MFVSMVNMVIIVGPMLKVRLVEIIVRVVRLKLGIKRVLVLLVEMKWVLVRLELVIMMVELG